MSVDTRRVSLENKNKELTFNYGILPKDNFVSSSMQNNSLVKYCVFYLFSGGVL